MKLESLIFKNTPQVKKNLLTTGEQIEQTDGSVPQAESYLNRPISGSHPTSDRIKTALNSYQENEWRIHQ
jgi:hypothetical protein